MAVSEAGVFAIGGEGGVVRNIQTGVVGVCVDGRGKGESDHGVYIITNTMDYTRGR